MILPIDPLTATALLTMAATSSDICIVPAAKINIIPKTDKVIFDTSQTHAEVQKAQIDTINPYGYNAKTHTNGYMSGEIKTDLRVKLDSRAVPEYNGYCLWYDRIDLTIHIAPTIVIPREVASDPCMHRAVKAHEMKHVMVDRKIVNKYAKILGRKIFEGLKQRGFTVGPVSASDAQAVATRMQQTVGQILELEYRKLDIERQEAQQAIDNLDEYKAVKAACPHFKQPGGS